ncbi:MAG: diguanylate cyclase, partial [Silvibacterium sp.]|nr:diguanylate cyclase [Silvibacterium sp.]
MSTDEQATLLLKKTVGEWQYPVHAVSETSAALKALTVQTPPAIALVDAHFASASGAQFAAEARRRATKSGAKNSTWLMLMCDKVDQNVVLSAMEAGVDDLLLKPVDIQDLRVRLRVAERVQMLTAQLDEQTRAVRFHASHDNLTGLWNRESLLNLLFPETDRVQRMRTPLTLLLLDLDRFSEINSE